MNRPWVDAYIGLGSNMGDRLALLTEAIRKLKNRDGVTLEAVSPVYETKPVGFVDQADFLNCVVKINTTLAPKELLAECMRIEQELKRERKVRWGPRTVDLDILFYDSAVLDEKELTIPHPRVQERGFVLVPLSDIAADLRHPILNRTIQELLDQYMNTHENPDDIRIFGRVDL